jgi:hypothetical protein
MDPNILIVTKYCMIYRQVKGAKGPDILRNQPTHENY